MQKLHTKQTLLLIITLCLLLAVSGAALAAADDAGGTLAAGVRKFSDVPESHWAFAHISRLSEAGALTGMPDGTFGPERSITRAEFVALVVGARLGRPEAPPPGQHWAANIMKTAAKNNLLAVGEFAPDTWDTPINRQEMAKIIALAARFVQKEAPVSETAAFTAGITDFASLPQSYRPYVAQAYAKGIVSGYQDGSFGGGRPATRAEAVVMVVRLIDPRYRLSGAELGSGQAEDMPSQVEENYTFNSAFTFSGFIHDQNSAPAAKLRTGRYGGEWNGCGWVAVYNAGVVLERHFAPADIIKYCDSHGGTLANGALGLNPLALKAYLNGQGLTADIHTLPAHIDSRIASSAVSVLLYLHGQGGHYTAIEYVDGMYYAYNNDPANYPHAPQPLPSVEAWLEKNGFGALSLITVAF